MTLPALTTRILTIYMYMCILPCAALANMAGSPYSATQAALSLPHDQINLHSYLPQSTEPTHTELAQDSLTTQLSKPEPLLPVLPPENSPYPLGTTLRWHTTPPYYFDTAQYRAPEPSFIDDFSTISHPIDTLLSTSEYPKRLPTDTAIPSAAWLIGAGLLGLAGLHRRHPKSDH